MSKASSWPNAIVRVDKEKGPTSHDVVSKVRRILGVSRVGHTGTLDPQATGLLLVCIGNATKLTIALQGLDKQYRATIGLGGVTETDDAESRILEERPCPSLTEPEVNGILQRFVGTIEQVPPRYCALKRDGQPFYKRARAGEYVVPPIRRVTIHAISLERLQGNDITILVDCGSGTYMRSLARDVGERIGCGGYLKELRRIRIGTASVEAAVSTGEFESRTPDSLWSIAEGDTRMILAPFPRAIIKREHVRSMVNGSPPEEAWFSNDVSTLQESVWVLVCDEDGTVVALASGSRQIEGFPLRLRRVLAR